VFGEKKREGGRRGEGFMNSESCCKSQKGGAEEGILKKGKKTIGHRSNKGGVSVGGGALEKGGWEKRAPGGPRDPSF